MELIDKIFIEHPYFGARRMRKMLRRQHGKIVSRQRVRRPMKMMGTAVHYCGRRRTTQRPHHKPAACAVVSSQLTFGVKHWLGKNGTQGLAPPHLRIFNRGLKRQSYSITRTPGGLNSHTLDRWHHIWYHAKSSVN
jgi:hypothetical protein